MSDLGVRAPAAQQPVRHRKVLPVAHPRVQLTLVRMLERITAAMLQDEMDEDTWVEAFEEELAQYHLAAYAHGAGLKLSQLTPEDHNLIQAVLDRQKEFLDGFREAAEEGRYEGREQVALHRADMYADATLGTWWMGHTRGWPLPAWPGDGTTQCKTRCRCAWQIVVLDGVGNADATWLLGHADHCQTCSQRSEEWAPVQIRDGELQLGGTTTKGWVTIHGHPVLIGAPGSGPSGGGSGGKGKSKPKSTGGGAGAVIGSPAAPTAVEKAQAKLDATNIALSDAKRLGHTDKLAELEAERVRNHGALYRARKAEKGGIKPPPELKPTPPPPTPAIEAIKKVAPPPPPVAKVTPLVTPGVIRGSDHAQATIDKLTAEKNAAKAAGDTNTVTTLENEIRYQRSRKYVLKKAEAKEDLKAAKAAGLDTPDTLRVKSAPTATSVMERLRTADLPEYVPVEKQLTVLKAQSHYRDMVTTYGQGSIFAGDALTKVGVAKRKALSDVATAQSAGRKVLLDALGDRPKSPFKVKFEGMEHLSVEAKGQVHEGLAFFRKMVGGGSMIDRRKVKIVIHPGPGRACYKSGRAEVHLYAQHSKDIGETTAHELGHWLDERNHKVRSAAIKWRDKRTAGQEVQKMQHLLSGGYDDSEVTKPDKFFHPYVGKQYKLGYTTEATEVTSMALQEFFSRPKELLKNDPEMFQVVWDAVTTK